jgi:hypothetical protein
MSRRSSVDTHPQREYILRDLATGVSGAEVARRYTGLSESAISRAKIAHFDALSTVLDDETPDVTDLLGRLADVADSTRDARRMADLTGTPAVRARAQSNELMALRALFDRMGVTDTTALRVGQATGLIVTAIRSFLDKHPDTTPEWLDLFGTRAACCIITGSP